MSAPRASGRAAAADTVFALAAVSLAAWSFWPVYQSAAFVVMLVVTVVLGCAIAVVGAVFRVPSIALTALIVGAFLAGGVPLAVPAETNAGGPLPTLPGFLDLVRGTWLSWKQLVTISLPVGSYQALLVPAFILVLLGSAVTLTIALRSKTPELAALPPVAVLVGGIALGSAVAPVPLWLVLALFGLLLVWNIAIRLRRRAAAVGTLRERSGLIVETPRERRSTAAITVTGAAIMFGGVAVIGVAATALLPPQAERQVVRSFTEQPFDPRAYPSPLSGFRSYLEPAKARAPMLSVTGLPADRRLRIATLDTYDGVVYSVGSGAATSASGAFTRVPYRLDQSGVNGTAARITVTVHGYRGPWVPGTGQLEQIAFLGQDANRLSGAFSYNTVTGTGASTVMLQSGDTYSAESVEKPLLTATQLERAQPGPDTVPRPAVVPDQLHALLQKYTDGVSGAGPGLAAALRGIARDGYLSHGIDASEPASRSGHGADRIAELLTDVPMLGDQEQYSVTAALLARQLGFPARVVVGFVAPKGSGDAVTFTGSDISAWIEVQTAEGWVSADPTPPVRPVPQKEPNRPTEISRPQTNVQPPVDESPRQNDEPPQAQVDPSPPPSLKPSLEGLRGILTIAGWSLLAVAVFTAPFLAVIAAKWRRRALRRRAPTAVERIVGGWREFADAAVDHGYERLPSATRVEFATAVGGSRAAALANVADRAVFSPLPLTSQEADSVWKAVDDLRRQLEKRDTRWKRLLAAVSLRSLGYRGRSAERKSER
ncbi:hypothetical protein ATY41_08760 [Leifsonia xyli subsp. xyli]|uniref:Transglutaminase-like domain-containing protein n=2 Tax=Leifsonia xyli subsp. xyli TaxID=59736 RepID=Q6AEZ1_LEIXX|nr:transglutaminase domain-containing protein [Leifsonia xyli]AAT89054.1 conserved hypothetical protein [Leifsonia xyli subsp. xyli str. CTCB07]ODA90729.1 hypothetical protein ATY41_08760 [Leifsonia xyli subsp. xyli]